MPKVLGVLGSRNALTKQIIQHEILNPILDDLGGDLTKVICPEEPLSSTFIECWADRKGIPFTALKSEWVTYGKKAGVMRDYQIEKNSSALLVFEGPRSRFYLDMAEKIAKRRPDCPVYVVAADSVTPVLLDVDYSVSLKEEATILTIPKMFGFGFASAKAKCLIED
jgi:hypothetical protein